MQPFDNTMIWPTILLASIFLVADGANHSIAYCDGCFCIPEPGQACPVHEMPQIEFSASWMQNLRTMVPANPINISCNPYTDQACTTEPPLEQGGACVIEYNAPSNGSACPTGYTYTYVGSESCNYALFYFFLVTTRRCL